MRLTVEIPTSHTAIQAWQIMTDWRAHAQWIPFTKMLILHESANSPAVGDRFIGRTGIGPIAFDDDMTVTRCEPPTPTTVGYCEVTKTGRLVKGRAYFTIESTETGSTLTWVEEINLPRPVEVLLGSALSRLGAVVFRSALNKALG
jgi:hypothetical protein